MSIGFLLSDNPSTWYRDITTDPVWEALADCANASEKRPAAPRPCNGFLPLQWAHKGAWCEKDFYECVDRSDKGDCAGKRLKTTQASS